LPRAHEGNTAAPESAANSRRRRARK